MAPLLLMLLLGPAQSPTIAVPPEPEVNLRLADLASLERCAGLGLQPIDGPPVQGGFLQNDLIYTPASGEVRRYMLLNRTIRGCPAPISYALPDRQGGIIRDLGAPSARSPGHRLSVDQPSRSRE